MIKFYSMIIPVYNESERISKTLRILSSWIKKKINTKYEILIIDDGSTDDTCSVIEELNIILKLNLKIFKSEHKGQFNAISIGVQKSSSDHPIVLEADLSASPIYIDTLFKHIPNYDIVTGSRFLNNSKIVNKPFYRDFISIFFLFLFKTLFKTKLSDPQFSFKIYNRDLFLKLSKNLVSKLDGMKSTEVMLRFEGHNKNIKEVPIEYIFYESDRNVDKSNILSLLFNCFYSLFVIWLNFKNQYKLKIIKKMTYF